MKRLRLWDLVLSIVTCLVIVMVACLFNGSAKSYFEAQAERRGDFTGIMLNLDLDEYERMKGNILLPRKIPFMSTEIGKADIPGSSIRIVVSDYDEELMKNIGEGALYAGHAPESPDEAVLSMSLLDDLKKDVGDEVDLTYDGAQYHLKIVGELKGVYNLWIAENRDHVYFPNVLVYGDTGIEYTKGNVMYWVMKLRTTDVMLAQSIRSDPERGSYVLRNPIYELQGISISFLDFFRSAGGRILTAVFLAAWYYQYFRKKMAMKRHIWNSDDYEGYVGIRRNILREDVLYLGLSAAAAISAGAILDAVLFNSLTGTVITVSDFIYEILLFAVVCIAFTVATSLLLARQWDYQRYVYDRQAYKKKSIFDFLRKYWIEILLSGGIIYLNVMDLKAVFFALADIDNYYDISVLAGGPAAAVTVNIIAAAYTMFIIVLLFAELARAYRDLNGKEKHLKTE